MGFVDRAFIATDVTGSDHCPVGVDLSARSCRERSRRPAEPGDHGRRYPPAHGRLLHTGRSGAGTGFSYAADRCADRRLPEGGHHPDAADRPRPAHRRRHGLRRDHGGRTLARTRPRRRPRPRRPAARRAESLQDPLRLEHGAEERSEHLHRPRPGRFAGFVLPLLQRLGVRDRQRVDPGLRSRLRPPRLPQRPLLGAPRVLVAAAPEWRHAVALLRGHRRRSTRRRCPRRPLHGPRPGTPERRDSEPPGIDRLHAQPRRQVRRQTSSAAPATPRAGCPPVLPARRSARAASATAGASCRPRSSPCGTGSGRRSSNPLRGMRRTRSSAKRFRSCKRGVAAAVPVHRMPDRRATAVRPRGPAARAGCRAAS